jgi:hypothetical protein
MRLLPTSKSGVYLSHPVYQIIWLSLKGTFFKRKIDLNFLSEYVGGGALKSLYGLSEEYISHYILIECRLIKAYCERYLFGKRSRKGRLAKAHVKTTMLA